MSMPEYIPRPYNKFMTRHPEVASAFEMLGQSCHHGGPLHEKTRHLIKLGAAAVQGHKGAVKTHVRRASEKGATPEEIRHVLLLVLTSGSFPTMIAAMQWMDDVLEARASEI